MNGVLLGVLAYVTVQLGIGVYVSRRTRDEADYLVAGRRLGLGMGVMTVFATWFGAETCIGAAGAVYHEGLSGGRGDPFGYALCILVMGVFFAAAFWRMGLTTLGDFYRRRYGAVPEKIAVFLMVPTSLLWAAAQIRAFGQVLSASSDLSVDVAIAIAAAVVIVYTVMGGLLADAISDVVQGGVLILGISVIAAAVLFGDHAGISIDDALSAERLRFSLPEESFLTRIESWSVPIMGSLFAQELVSRSLASKSAGVARGACVGAAGLYFVVGLMPVGLGLVGPAFVPGLEDGEQILPMLAQTFLPTALYVVFAGALVSAILSTVDSALLACAGLVSHNIVVPMRPDVSERQKVFIARAMVAVFGVVAYVMAMYAEGVYALVEEASSFGSAGLFAAAVFGFLSRRGGAKTATACLLTGLVSYVCFSHLLDLETPFIYSVAAAVVAWWMGALLETPPSDALRDSMANP